LPAALHDDGQTAVSSDAFPVMVWYWYDPHIDSVRLKVVRSEPFCHQRIETEIRRGDTAKQKTVGGGSWGAASLPNRQITGKLATSHSSCVNSQ